MLNLDENEKASETERSIDGVQANAEVRSGNCVTDKRLCPYLAAGR